MRAQLADNAVEINKTLAKEKAMMPALQGRNHAATPPAELRQVDTRVDATEFGRVVDTECLDPAPESMVARDEIRQVVLAL